MLALALGGYLTHHQATEKPQQREALPKASSSSYIFRSFFLSLMVVPFSALPGPPNAFLAFPLLLAPFVCPNLCKTDTKQICIHSLVIRLQLPLSPPPKLNWPIIRRCCNVTPPGHKIGCHRFYPFLPQFPFTQRELIVGKHKIHAEKVKGAKSATDGGGGEKRKKSRQIQRNFNKKFICIGLTLSPNGKSK